MYSIGFCGYNRNETDYFSINRPHGSGDYLFLLFLKPSYIFSSRQTILAQPNACILYPPGKPQNYKAVKIFQNSYVHFTADHDFISEYQIPLSTVIYSDAHEVINKYLRDILIETIHKTKHYERKLDCLLEQILIELSREIYRMESHLHNVPFYLKFQEIRSDIVNNCEQDWTIERIGKLVNMEKSQLYKYYLSFFNVTPKMDIINARIEKAKYLLTNEDIQVYQVAEMCGFKNISHFTRYFKKRCHCSPTAYAKSKSKENHDQY
jgi:AraC-like DNA-binding protein